MEANATGDLNGALNEFIAELLQTPIRSDRFIALFTRTDDRSGIVQFSHQFSDRQATANWEVFIEGKQLLVSIKYNRSYEILRSTAGAFRQELAHTLPVF